MEDAGRGVLNGLYAVLTKMNEDHYLEAATTIKTFLDGSCGDYDWDDFISIRSRYTQIQCVKNYCANSSFCYPPTEESHWCNEIGIDKLAQLSRLLRTRNKEAITMFLDEESK